MGQHCLKLKEFYLERDERLMCECDFVEGALAPFFYFEGIVFILLRSYIICIIISDYIGLDL